MKNPRRSPGEKERQCKADFTRTCEGCEYIREEDRGDSVCYRCFAPGPYQGYSMGVDRIRPYIPAWCPKKKGEVT